MERSEARALGLNKYSTGKPCTNGHVAERYVQSGSCVACIAQSVVRARDEYAAEQTAPRAVERRAFNTLVIDFKQRVPLDQLESIRSIAVAMLTARFPLLANDGRVLFDPDPRPTHKAAGTAMVRFLAHRDDEATIRAMCNAACVAHGQRSPVVVPLPPSAPEPFVEPDHLSRNYTP